MKVEPEPGQVNAIPGETPEQRASEIGHLLTAEAAHALVPVAEVVPARGAIPNVLEVVLARWV